MRKVVLLVMLNLCVFGTGNAQIQKHLYAPVSLISLRFDTDDNFMFGVGINNYGFHYQYAALFDNKVIILGIQNNSGKVEFDPLNFNQYFEQGEETHLIQSRPTKMFYGELGFGLCYQNNSKRYGFSAGIGHQFSNSNTRLYFQADMGAESKMVNAGISLRGNYTVVLDQQLLTLEPVVETKVKIWKIRLVNQFGYSIAIIGIGYMKPVLTFGIEYVMNNFPKKVIYLPH